MSRDRYVVVGIIVLAMLVGLPLAHGFAWTAVRFGWPDPRLLGDLTLTSALGYAIAAAAALFCLFHVPTRTVAGEIVDELAKVTWPSREETGNATVVVIVTVLICSAYLGVFDAVWLWLTNRILGVG
jgi:preprotein translocase subunit SecE